MKKKIIVAKVSDDGRQKRLTIPNQKETKEWEQGDLIKLEKIKLKWNTPNTLKGGVSKK